MMMKCDGEKTPLWQEICCEDAEDMQDLGWIRVDQGKPLGKEWTKEKPGSLQSILD